MKTSQAGSTFPNLCGESTSAMSSAADEGEEAEEEEELDDGGEETNDHNLGAVAMDGSVVHKPCDALVR